MTQESPFVARSALIQEPSWLRLDNAAKIYPAVQNEEFTAVFRLSCILKAPVKATVLLETVRRLEDRFPYYKVKPKKGFFWYYLDFHNESTMLVPDLGTPCRAFDKESLLFRILVRGKRLSVEFSHILTDGGGALEFLKTLLLTYFETTGIPAKNAGAWMNPDDTPKPEEFEDGFSKHFQANIPTPKKKPKSFHLPFSLNAPPRFNLLVARTNLIQVSQTSKNYGISITEYLVAVYLYSLQMIYKQLPTLQRRTARKIFRIQVPINLRRIYKSRTMRNFSLFVTPEIDMALGDYSFEEIAKTVHHTMQLETDRKLIDKMIARNVGAERNVWLKNTPLFVKSLILKWTYTMAGPSRYSGVITNLGKVSLGQLDNLIDYLVFIPPPPNKTLKINCGVLGFGNDLVLSFGNITTSKALERTFIQLLVKHGIGVKIVNY